MEKPTRLALLKEIAEFLNEETEIYTNYLPSFPLLAAFVSPVESQNGLGWKGPKDHEAQPRATGRAINLHIQ